MGKQLSFFSINQNKGKKVKKKTFNFR